MSKRLQIAITDDAWGLVEKTIEEASKDFCVGNITYSDVICEMILSSRIDIKALQIKHTDLRRSLKALASKPNLDVDAAIKSLMDLKSRSSKKPKVSENEEASD